MRSHSIRPRGFAATWGAKRGEIERSYPCDGYLPNADAAYVRGVDVAAPAATVYRWLCQLRVAPYSYDWLDNAGRQSPRRLIPGLEQLATGQRMCRIFELVDFAPGQHLTMVMAAPGAIGLFGDIALTYIAVPHGPERSRLLAKLLVRYPRRGLPRLMRWLLPWGDLVMMRKQLLTFKALAERSAAHGEQADAAPWTVI